MKYFILLLLLFAGVSTASAQSKFVDCSLLVAPDYPATWPTAPFPRFQIIHQRTILSRSIFLISLQEAQYRQRYIYQLALVQQIVT